MKNKRQLIAIAGVFILLASNLIRTSALQQVRTVDLLQILACGALIGVFVTQLFMLKK